MTWKMLLKWLMPKSLFVRIMIRWLYRYRLFSAYFIGTWGTVFFHPFDNEQMISLFEQVHVYVATVHE
jgi:hypothetical protein